MSTRATISVMLKECDLGKALRPKKELLHAKLACTHGNPTLHESAFTMPFVSIFHHWDGVPPCLGSNLSSHYATYEKALNLILFGDADSINADEYNNHNIFFYNYWKNIEWDTARPLQFKTKGDLDAYVRTSSSEYSYILMPNGDGEYEWFCAKVSSKMKYMKLSQSNLV